MKKIFAVLAASLTLATAAPALAQYHPGPGGNGNHQPYHPNPWQPYQPQGRYVYVTCQSENYSPATCRVNGNIERVSVSHQLSTAEPRGGQCSYGRDYTYDSQRIYVYNGCRAQFLVELR